MRTARRTTFLLAVLVPVLFASGCAVRAQQNPDPAWTVRNGLNTPESAYYHPESGVIFVSSIAGEATGKDGRGWISKIRPDGTVVEKKWVEGLNAPKGLRSDGDILWVSDIDRLLGFRLSDGRKVHDVSIEDAQFLNDVAVGYDGTVYVSASRTDRIFRYRNGSVRVFAKGAPPGFPNGLLVSGRRLLVAGESAGDGRTGPLVAIDLKTGDRSPLSSQSEVSVDGLELDGRGNYLVSDWSAGTVYRLTPSGGREPIVNLDTGTADIGFIQRDNLLLIPQMKQGTLTAYRIGPEREYRNLIDRRLSHWRTEGNWTVTEDRRIVLEPRPGEEGWKRFEDYLTSKKTFGNVELHVEYKIPEDGNSGVFFRIQNPAKPVTTGIEVQILDSFDEQGKLGPHDNGGIIRTSGPSKNMSRPSGTWNHMMIIVRNRHLRVILNGEQIQDLSLKNTPVADRPNVGHISLQDHGLPFEVRSIRIRELDE